MSMGEAEWRTRAETAEATLSTMKQNHELAIERVRTFKANFGVRERQNGEIDIDFDLLVERIGQIGALELRKIIDARYHISGDSGEKPRMKLVMSESQTSGLSTTGYEG